VDRGVPPYEVRREHRAIRPVNPVTFFPAPVPHAFFAIEPRYHSQFIYVLLTGIHRHMVIRSTVFLKWKTSFKILTVC
jgi:hypothetical protein